MPEFAAEQPVPPLPARGLKKAGTRALHWASVLLVVTVWVSAGLFGLYILAAYAAAFYGGNLAHWNKTLPGLYQPGARTATAGIGLHFAMGGIILLLGSLQLIEAVRVRYPAIHRWVGRVYVGASLLAAVGGITFILANGTIGGPVMDVGFGLYGVLMLVAGIETIRHARAGRLPQHRAWALRLYALAIGSWLYRMDYGFWLMLANGLGHLQSFTGPFDRIMAFFFYLPNLLLVEVFIRARTYKVPPVLYFMATLVLVLMTGFLLVGTYYFTKFYWGPAILGLVLGK